MKTGLSRPLFQKCSAGTSIHSEFTTSGPDLRTSKGWALLCLLWLAEKSPCPENLETWDLGLLSQQKLGPLLVFLWRVLQLPEEKRIMVKPFHRSSSQAWLKESSVKFMGKKQWTKAKQSAHVVVLPLLHRSLGTYSVGDCTLISEGEIMEKGDRSLGGEEIKETHLPWYRKKYLYQNKNLLQKAGVLLKKLHKKVAVISLVALEATFLPGTAVFLWEALCRAGTWQSDPQAAGHKQLCLTWRALEASLLLGDLNISLGGTALLSSASENTQAFLTILYCATYTVSST